MKLDQAAWAEIRRACETTAEPLQQIADRYGVSRRRIYDKGKREAWLARPSPYCAKPESNAAVSGDASEAPPFGKRRRKRKPDTVLARALRLLRLIDMQLDQMEIRMTEDELVTAQDQERQARAFSTLVGQLETVMQTIADKDRAPGRSTDEGTTDDADRLRREITERLERLNAQWLAQSKPE